MSLTPNESQHPEPEAGRDPFDDADNVDRAFTPDESDGDTPGDDTKRQRRLPWPMESVLVFLLGLAIALLARHFLVQAYEIPSSSMVDTLHVDDRVVVNKQSYRGGQTPDRGDIVVFQRPNVSQCVFDESDPKVLIKRVIGLPGDVVSGRGGYIYIDGKKLDEPWFDSHIESREFADITVGPKQILLLGDNRLNSKDGTCFGPVKVSAVVGRAMFRVWPLNRLGGL